MSDWILYDDLVDLVREHHRQAYSGLITGLSDRRHSFQLGFDRGEIILLSYRIKKGLDALPMITQIERAKITDHPASDFAAGGNESYDTDAVLAELSACTIDETSVTATDISNLTAPRRRF